MGKPTICLGENKGADQLRSDREADQRLCFRYSDSAVPMLLKSKISSFYLFSVTVQVHLCPNWSETTLLVFPQGGSNNKISEIHKCKLVHFKLWKAGATYMSTLMPWHAQITLTCVAEIVIMTETKHFYRNPT